jgi:hypothetical protein
MTDADLLARYVDVFNEPGMTVHAIYRHLDGSFFVRNIFPDDPPTTTVVTEKQVRGVLIHESIGSLRRHLTAAGEEFLKDAAS